MPGLDGFTLAEWLRNDARLAGPVILMLSGTDRRNQAKRCQELGALCLEKPVSQSNLFNFIAEALGIQQQATETADSTPSVSLAAVPPRVLRVLLAEDTVANQKLVTFILTKRGHTVEVVQNGQQALDLLCQKEFDVVLMDVQMPVMDGFEATQAIRKLDDSTKACIPIIAMTAHALKGDEERCLDAGMDGYLSKPINGHEMIGLLENLNAEVASAPTEPVNSTTVEVFDSGVALKRCFDSPQVLEEMIQYFHKEAEVLIPQMHVALQNGDLLEVGRLGHRLKGTVVHLGADAASEAATKVEQFYRGTGEQAEAKEAVNALKRQCDLLKAAVVEHQTAAQ